MASTNKDQEMFINHCKERLGGYDYHRAKAKEFFNLAYDAEPFEYKKQNAGIRAGNLYLLAELKKVDAEKWRQEKGDNKPKTPPAQKATGEKVNSGVKNMKPLPKGMQGIKLDW